VCLMVNTFLKEDIKQLTFIQTRRTSNDQESDVKKKKECTTRRRSPVLAREE